MGIISSISRSKFWLPITLLVLVLLNWLAARWHQRIDFTNEQRFTLSAPTKKIVRQLQDEVQVEVFLKGASNSAFTRLGKSTGELLAELKEQAGSKLQYRFIDPSEEVEGSNATYGDTLTAMGLPPINLTSQVKQGQQQQLVFPYALVRYQDRTIPIELYNSNKAVASFKELNSAEAQLEYKFADAIDKLTNPTKPMLAYSTGNGEPQGGNVQDLVENVLRPDYNLFMFDLERRPIPDTFKLLMIVKPTKPFSDMAKLHIDQFVMRGGKLLLFIDKLDAEMDSLRIKNEVIAYDRGLELNDLLFKYGTRINGDLVMDLQCDFLPFDVNGNGQYEYLHWNYFPLFEPQANHPITKSMGLVAGRFVNSVDTIEAEGIRKTILLHSSVNGRSITTPALISGKENVTEPEHEKFKKPNIPVAVLLEGRFQSLYRNRASQAMIDSMAAYGVNMLQECIADNQIVVVADGDMVLNSIVKQEPIPMGMNPFTVGSQYEYPFANRDFLQNCLSYLLNQNGLQTVKGKDYSLRLLDSKKTAEQQKLWQLINIVAPLLLVALFGIVYQWWRKRKYGRAGSTT
jgi:ABC-2 type transport system permease protein